MNQFSPYALSGKIYLMAKKQVAMCPVLSRIFTQTKGNDAINISWDIIEGSAQLMRALSIYSPAYVGSNTKRKTVLAQLPKLHEIRNIPAGTTLLLERQTGDRKRAMRRLADATKDEQMDLVQKFVNTLEYMGAHSLRGSIVMVDENGDSVTVADWDLPADHTPAAYAGSDQWTHDDSDPAQDIEDLKVVIVQTLQAPVEKWYLFAGTSVTSALRVNKSLKGDGRRLKLKDVAEELEIDEVVPYPYTYEDQNSTWQRFIAKNQAILVAYSSGFYSLQYMHLNAALQLSAQSGGAGALAGDGDMGMGKLSDKDVDKMFVMSEAFVKRNPRVVEVSSESYPLPVCHAPGSTARITPVS